MEYDCVVIGSGIAGLTASIYLKRSNLKILVLESATPGGLLNKISKIENYPGFKEISGPKLAENILEQINNLDIEIRYGKVININDNVITTDIEQIKAKKIILAIGKSIKKQDNLLNVSYCATCDANMYKDKVVAIIGNDNRVISEALYLSDICKKVYMLYQTNLTGEDILIEKINNKNNIEIYDNCIIKQLISDKNILKSIETNTKKFIVDGMFIYQNNIPDTEFLKDIKKDNNYIIVDNNMKTNIDYIYACGDVIKKDVYQLTTAASEATIAAINVKKSLM